MYLRVGVLHRQILVLGHVRHLLDLPRRHLQVTPSEHHTCKHSSHVIYLSTGLSLCRQETPIHLRAVHPLLDSYPQFVCCRAKGSRINLFSGMTVSVNTTGRVCKPWRRGSDSQAPHKCLASLSVHFDSNSRSSVYRVRLLPTRFSPKKKCFAMK